MRVYAKLLCFLASTSLAVSSAAQLTGSYHAALNTMPAAQGWKLYGYRDQGPNDFLSGGLLNLKPTRDWNYYGRAVGDPMFPALERPFDLANGFDITFRVKVNSGQFSVYVSGNDSRGYWVDVLANGNIQVNLATFRAPFTSLGEVHSPSTRFHTYRMWGDGKYLRFSIDGDLPVHVTPDYCFIFGNTNLLYFGDVWRNYDTDAELAYLNYTLEGLGPGLGQGGGGGGGGGVTTTRRSFVASPSLAAAGSGPDWTVDNFFTLTASTPGFSTPTPPAVSYRASTQAGVSTAGFGVALPNDTGISAGRGIDGDGANGAVVEQLALGLVNPNATATAGEITFGLNAVGAVGDPGYTIEAYNGSTLVGTIQGTLPGLSNTLVTVPVSFGGTRFNRLLIRNSHQTADSFVVHGAALDIVN